MPTKSEKRNKKLRAFAKRRSHRPQPTITTAESLKASGNVTRRITNQYPSLLLSIESTLAQAANELQSFDDHCVEKVLRTAILQKDLDDTLNGPVLEALNDIQPLGNDAWLDALRVIYSSVKRRSDCKPGDRSYLDYVNGFVNQAVNRMQSRSPQIG